VTGRLLTVQLPQSWVTARLDSIAEVVLGQSPPSSTYNDSGKGLPFYQGKLEFGKIYPTPKKWCSEPKKIAEKGDVLISVRAPVGPTNISPEKSCIGRGLAAIRGLDGIETLFILYLLRVNENVLVGKGTGTTFSAISGEQLRSLKIPVPPLNEQSRIVGKIEELFSFLDAGSNALHKVQVQLKSYRKTVLKYAFEGKLTKDWRKTHCSLLEPIYEEADNQRIPPQWVLKPLSTVSEVQMGQSPPGSSYSDSRQGTPLLNGPTEFGINHPNPQQWTNKPVRVCRKGDLLICVRGNTTGRMNWADQEYCIGRGLASITAFEKLANSSFVHYFLLKEVNEIMRRTTGSTFPNLKSTELKNFELPLPPVDERCYCSEN
jgi:restriction endonuclease S subunit